MKDFFSSRGFPFGSGASPELSIQIGEGMDEEEGERKGEEIISLKKLSTKERNVLVRDYLNRHGYRGFLSGALPEDYFERDLSCFLGRKTGPRALLLIHLTPGGRLRVEYAHSSTKNMGELNQMLDMAFSEAAVKYSGKTILSICPDSLEFFTLLGMDRPCQKGFFVEEGMRLRR